MTKDFNILVKKLSSFRNKYYSYKVIKGFMLTFFLLLTVILFFALLEYFIYMPSGARIIIVYSFMVFAVFLFVHFVIIPLLKLFHIIKPLNIKSSSVFIQDHFRKIQDKLLNIIELSEIESDTYSSDIVKASIDQKINELNIFDFREAVQFKNLRIVFIYFVLSIFVTSGFFVLKKSVFTSSFHRFINYKTEFVKPAPYNFVLLNNELVATKGESFKILLECKGNMLPQIVYINIEGNNYIMSNVSPGKFEFDIASVINPVNFYFTDLKYKSEEYFIDLLPAPGITNFTAEVQPPSYTGIVDKKFENLGDLQVPNGTKVKWNFTGIDIDTLYLFFSDSTIAGASKSDQGFEISKTFYKSENYNVFVKNDLTEFELALSYSVDVIPDLYPEIKVVRVRDSLKMTRYFFKGIVGDDYGFSGLDFHYNVDNNDSAIAIPFVENLTEQDFYFSYDFAEVPASSGNITYYFTVTDNDVVNDYKTTTSNGFTMIIPDRNEIAETENEKFNKLEKMLKESHDLANEIQNDINSLRLKNMDSNITDWEKSQMVNDMVKKQNKLENLYEKIKINNEELNNYIDSFNRQNEEIREKQQQIEELLNEVFTDELKKLLEEFNKLAEKFDSKKLNSLSDKMNLTYEDLQKQLDRNLEMLRKMKVEQKLQNVIDEMRKMASEEDKFSRDINEKENYEDTENKVSGHKKELSIIENDLHDGLKLNNELKNKLNFDDFDEEFQDIDKSMDESLDQLGDHRKKKSGQSLKRTSHKLENSAFAMQQMLDSNEIREKTENIENLRQILSNLIFISFQQEKILKDLNNISVEYPVLNTLNLEQKRIKDQSVIVSDSLYALAGRTPQINTLVNNELLTLILNLDNVCDQLEEGLFSDAKSSQQYIITAANNLALMLNEALENLEKQLADSCSGCQQCENPGNKKGGINLLKKTSDNIRKQLEQMIEQLKKGGNKPGQRQFGEMLMRHEMMQQMLRDIMNDGDIGSPARYHLRQIDKMLEQNRKELLSKNINADMIIRQNQITSRLLEAEKAEMERDYEKKREGRVAEDFYSNPVEFFEYKKEKDVVIENFNRNSHKLTNFYSKKYKQYLNNFENR